MKTKDRMNAELRDAVIYHLAPSPAQRAWEDRERAWRDPLLSMHVARVPYPVTPEAAAAIEFASRNRILSWHAFRTCNIYMWVFRHFAARGGRVICPNYWSPYLRPADLCNRCPEVRDRFADASSFSKFAAGKDYSHNLADVTDCEFAVKADALERTIRRAIAKHCVSTGLRAYLPSVWHVRYLEWAPLADKRWLDAYVVGLAEFGAVLAHRGFRRVASDDLHALAAPRYAPRDCRWEAPQFADPAEIEAARLFADENLQSCPARRTEIDGRGFIDAEDYAAWTGSQLNSKSVWAEGVALQSWNEWVRGRRSASAVKLAGIEVGSILQEAMVRDRDFAVCKSAQLQNELATRRRTLRALSSRSDAMADNNASATAPNAKFVPNKRQSRILAALNGQALTTDDLAKSANCDRRTLFRKGGIKGLRGAGLVDHRHGVGFYRPDAPPAELAKYLSPQSH
jgi:hypothetical protein